jgi:flagellar basal body rod protein FlgB
MDPVAASGGGFPVLQRTGEFGRDENGVDVDAEMARLAEATIEYNTAAQLLSARLNMLRMAVSEGRR